MSDVYGITIENLMAVFPPSLSLDKRVLALAEATATLLVARLPEIPLTDVYGHLDRVGDGVLDILADDFNIAWYDRDASHDVKLNTVKDAFYVYRHIGTKSAVLTVLRSLYPDSDLQEWFEYGGSPYTCRLTLNNGDSFCDTEELVSHLERLDLYKNLRTWIESVAFSTKKEAPVYVGLALLYQERETFTVTEAWPSKPSTYLTDEYDRILTDEHDIMLVE